MEINIETKVTDFQSELRNDLKLVNDKKLATLEFKISLNIFLAIVLVFTSGIVYYDHRDFALLSLIGAVFFLVLKGAYENQLR